MHLLPRHSPRRRDLSDHPPAGAENVLDVRQGWTSRYSHLRLVRGARPRPGKKQPSNPAGKTPPMLHLLLPHLTARERVYAIAVAVRRYLRAK